MAVAVRTLNFLADLPGRMPEWLRAMVRWTYYGFCFFTGMMLGALTWGHG